MGVTDKEIADVKYDVDFVMLPRLLEPLAILSADDRFPPPRHCSMMTAVLQSSSKAHRRSPLPFSTLFRRSSRCFYSAPFGFAPRAQVRDGQERQEDSLSVGAKNWKRCDPILPAEAAMAGRLRPSFC